MITGITNHRFPLWIPALLALGAVGRPAHAELSTLWAPGGIPVAAASGFYQSQARALPDGQGGMFLVWTQFSEYAGTKGWIGGDIYAQHLDSNGKQLWGASGVRVCGAIGEQTSPCLTSDGQGGLIVAWDDTRAGTADIYAQRVLADGSLGFAHDAAVCTALNIQQHPEIASDALGNATIAWEDYRTSKNNEDVYGRRMRPDGTFIDTPDIVIGSGPGQQFWPRVAVNATGGSLVGYTSKEAAPVSSDPPLVDIEAVPLPASGPAGAPITVCAETGDQVLNDIKPDGKDGFLLAWWDYRNGAGNGDIYLQHYDASLTPLWGPTGEAVDARAGDQYLPTLVPTPTGPFVLYFEFGDKDDLRAARVGADGAVLWTGVTLAAAPFKQVYPVGALDGWGGLYVAWEDYRNDPAGEQPDVYMQHLSGKGEALWGEGGVPLAGTSYYEKAPVIVPDAAHGAIVAWEDWGDISGGQQYAQRIAEAAAPLAGDVNGDGAVTVADAAVLLRVAAGFDDGSGLVMALADLAPAAPGGAAGYGDGVINLADVARVARAAAGTETLP